MSTVLQSVQRHPVSVLAGAVILVSFLLPPHSLPGLEVCAFKRNTGLPCPGCGLTHAFCAISHGQFALAWNYHPYAAAVYTLTLAAALWPVTGRFLAGNPTENRALLRILIGAVAAGTTFVTLFGVLRIYFRVTAGV